MVKTCAICRAETYDADPIQLHTRDGFPVRLWLCSPECAYHAGGRASLHANGPCLSLAELRATYDAGGIEPL